MQRIVAAVDHSEPSLRAVRLAADLAGKYGAALVLLTVVRDAGAPDAGMEAFAAMEHIHEPVPALHIEAARDGLSALRDSLMQQGSAKVTVEAAAGDPAEQIIGFARDDRADLIVLGSRGHGRLAGLLLGSVAQKVVALAGCPVLVVP